jgi:hypothetical protein
MYIDSNMDILYGRGGILMQYYLHPSLLPAPGELILPGWVGIKRCEKLEKKSFFKAMRYQLLSNRIIYF